MKKLLLAALAATMGLSACSSSNTKNDNEYYSQKGYAYTSGTEYNNTTGTNGQYQIIDQEFDNLLAPDTDYDSIPAYELQACGDNYLPPAKTALKGTSKPSKSTGTSSARKKSASKAVKTQTDASSSTNVSTTKKVVNNTNIYYLDGSAPTTSTTSTTTYTSDEALPDTI